MEVRANHLLTTALAIFVAVAVASFGSPGRATALLAPDEQRSITDDPEPDRSVLQGVYTDEQRKRGQGVYADACASCHAAALTGADVVPALVGADFLGRWTGATAGELFERIRSTMPQDSPGSLSPQQYADIVALIFNKNRFPAGRTPLPDDDAALRMIRIETSKKR
jgi:S-disulfanyl-L-cysteine oxidoreductase SoxD